MSDDTMNTDPLAPDISKLYHQAVLDVMRWAENHDRQLDHDTMADCVIQQAKVIHDLRGMLSPKSVESAARTSLNEAMQARFA